MLGAATPTLAVNVSNAGGFGFVAGAPKSDVLDKTLNDTASLVRSLGPLTASTSGTLPIGVGFQTWGCDVRIAAAAIKKHVPAAVWLFAPNHVTELSVWADELRAASAGKTHIWVQVGTVGDAKYAFEHAGADVIVVQGSDAGGHGLAQSASVTALVPEVIDMLKRAGGSHVPILAAGGIAEQRGLASMMALGAGGAVMGTRFLAAKEAGIAPGWQREILRTNDGGIATCRSTLCDRLKETAGWPAPYDGRAIKNKGHADEASGMPDHENVQLYKDELASGDDAWGPHGRMVTYAGTGVGLVKEVKPAAAIVSEVASGARGILRGLSDESRDQSPKAAL